MWQGASTLVNKIDLMFISHSIPPALFLLLGVSVLSAQVTLTSSPNPSILGQPVTLSVTGASSGLVAFYDGATLLGSSPVSSGSARLTTTLLPSGVRPLRARYQASQSNVVQQTVNAQASYAFKPASYFSIGNIARTIAQGDFNRDGKPDLAVASVADTSGGGAEATSLIILLGDGAGGLRNAATYSLGSVTTYGLAAIDVDGDGAVDLVAGGSGGVSWLRSGGDGTFAPAAQISSVALAFAIAAGDFNGDGLADVIVYSPSTLTVLKGNGSGSFTAISQAFNGVTGSIGVADLNGDGKADLVVDGYPSASAGVLIGNGDGTFRAAAYSGATPAGFAAVADLNGDGKPDLVAAQTFSGPAFLVLLGNGDGSFNPGAAPFGPYQFSAAVTDFNGDGKPDLVTNDLESVRVYLGRGDGTFADAVIYLTGRFLTVPLAVGDWNGDGEADVIFVGSPNQPASYSVGVLASFTSPKAALTLSLDHNATTAGSGVVTYTIRIGNGTTADRTSGLVVVTETIAGAFTMTGDGWSCGGGSCTRSDALNAGASYPPITAQLTRVVFPNSDPSMFTNVVGVYGGSSRPAVASDTIRLPALTPNSPSPGDGTYAISSSAQLSWTGEGGQFFDLYFGTSSPAPLAASNLSSNSYNPGPLTPCATYYWRVVSKAGGVSVTSPEWSFTVQPSVTLIQDVATFSGSGGSGSFPVATSGNCAWTATTPVGSFVTITQGGTGVGAGSVYYSVQPYSDYSSRSASIFVAEQVFTVFQDGIGTPSRCITGVTGPAYIDSTAQSVAFTVSANPSCDWLLNHDNPSVTWLTTPTFRNLNTVAVSANTTGAPRSETLRAQGYVYAYLARPFTVTQRATAVTFADVALAYPFFDAINLLRGRAITDGCASAPLRFCPDANITRGQMAVFVVRAIMGGDNFSYSTTPYFTDAPAGHQFFKWIQKMWELGITNGCGAATYCPDSPVTRGQMAVFIIRARLGATATFSYPAAPLFNDTANSFYFSWIQKMGQLGITTGCAPGQYCPDDPVSRGQMAVFIMRGAFNQLLPGPRPVVVSVSPNTASVGQTVTVTITGQNTYFNGGAPQMSAGPGITIIGISVNSATSLTAQIRVAADAAPGPRSITVTVPGEIEATLPNGFRVQ